MKQVRLGAQVVDLPAGALYFPRIEGWDEPSLDLIIYKGRAITGAGSRAAKYPFAILHGQAALFAETFKKALGWCELNPV